MLSTLAQDNSQRLTKTVRENDLLQKQLKDLGRPSLLLREIGRRDNLMCNQTPAQSPFHPACTHTSHLSPPPPTLSRPSPCPNSLPLVFTSYIHDVPLKISIHPPSPDPSRPIYAPRHLAQPPQRESQHETYPHLLTRPVVPPHHQQFQTLRRESG